MAGNWEGFKIQDLKGFKIQGFKIQGIQDSRIQDSRSYKTKGRSSHSGLLFGCDINSIYINF
jgi:hypothetical protein